MAFWTGPVIRGGDPSLRIFDEWRQGYAFADAIDILGRIGEPGRDVYLGHQRILDTIFPVSLTGFLSLGIFLTLRRWSRSIAVVLALFPLAYLAADLAENAAVAAVLQSESLSPEQVAVASGWTRLKWLLFNVSLLLLGASLVTRLVAGVIAGIRGRP